MTSEFFKAFPPLWDAFELQIKEKYTELILTGSLEKINPVDRAVSKIYDALGWEYWLFSNGAASQWIKQFEEIFFENKYYKLKKKLYDYNGLDTLVADSIKRFPKYANALLRPHTFLMTRNGTGRFYRLTLKPHLDARKQEIINELGELEKELQQPIPYTLELPVDGKTQKLLLEFQSKYRKHDTGRSMEGYTYSYNGRTYKDIASLWAKDVEDLSADVFIGMDAYGEKVLKIYTGIPTFDSADREWDSRVLEHLMFDGKAFHLVVMRGGYRIASLTFYEKLLSADARMKPVFEKLGWPMSGISWK